MIKLSAANISSSSLTPVILKKEVISNYATPEELYNKKGETEEPVRNSMFWLYRNFPHIYWQKCSFSIVSSTRVVWWSVFHTFSVRISCVCVLTCIFFSKKKLSQSFVILPIKTFSSCLQSNFYSLFNNEIVNHETMKDCSRFHWYFVV